MQLSQEKFDYQLTLANLGLQISQARGVLAELETKKLDFLKAQEKEMMERVTAVVDASSEALNVASKNQGLLLAWEQDLLKYTELLGEINTDLDKKAVKIADKTRAIFAEIDANLVQIREQRTDIERQKATIEASKHNIGRQLANLQEKQTKLTSQQASLDLAYRELTAKKGK